MRIMIEKSRRLLRLLDGDNVRYACRIALGNMPAGAKEMEGDGKTPEGNYDICLVKDYGKYGRSIGLGYPNALDAQRALQACRIDQSTYDAICKAHEENRRPPWGSPLGGEIYIHEGGAQSDWTQGCIALNEMDMDMVFPHWKEIEAVEILP